MKKWIIKIFVLVNSLNVFSQSQYLDSTFGIDGKVVTNINSNERAHAVVIQPDGKILVGGYTFSNTFGFDILCVRYNSNGSIDNTFGTNGIAQFDIQLGSDDKAYGIDLQQDGKIVLAGYSDDGSNRDGLVMRLNSDGTLDNTFGNNGKVLTNFSFSGFNVRQDEYKVVKIHALTGNIVVGGTSYSASNNSRGIMARYTSNGTLDTSFATNGMYSGLPISLTTSTNLFSIEDLAIKSNGKITIVGWSSAYFYLARLNSNGTMDTTFNTTGYNHQWGGRMYGMELNSDDSFYFTGDIWNVNNGQQSYTGRIGSSGGASITATPVSFGSNFEAYSYDVEKDSNGNLYIVGRIRNVTTNITSFLVGRLTASHVPDNSFGSGGFINTVFDSNTTNIAYRLKLQADGKIVVVGTAGNKVSLARYNPSVLSQSAFNTSDDDLTIFPIPSNDVINIKFQKFNDEAYKYQIINSVGQVLQVGEFVSENQTIKIENFPKGIYFLRIGDKNLKFIKK